MTSDQNSPTPNTKIRGFAKKAFMAATLLVGGAIANDLVVKPAIDHFANNAYSRNVDATLACADTAANAARVPVTFTRSQYEGQGTSYENRRNELFLKVNLTSAPNTTMATLASRDVKDFTVGINRVPTVAQRSLRTFENYRIIGKSLEILDDCAQRNLPGYKPAQLENPGGGRAADIKILNIEERIRQLEQRTLSPQPSRPSRAP